MTMSGATPDIRTQARNDNAEAAARRNPALHVFGPNTCSQGFVWREADDSDFVCVMPDERARVRAENANPTANRAGGGPFGPDTCNQGFVWRDAYPGDHICVPPPRRSAVLADNGQAQARLMKPQVQ